MRPISLFIFAGIFVACPNGAHAQSMVEREKEFLQAKPLIGNELPDVTVYSPDGTPFHTADLRGHYTVLTFGCLT